MCPLIALQYIVTLIADLHKALDISEEHAIILQDHHLCKGKQEYVMQRERKHSSVLTFISSTLLQWSKHFLLLLYCPLQYKVRSAIRRADLEGTGICVF